MKRRPRKPVIVNAAAARFWIGPTDSALTVFLLVLLAGLVPAQAHAQIPGVENFPRGLGPLARASGPSQYPTGPFHVQGTLEMVTHDAVGVRAGDGGIYEALLPAQGAFRAAELIASYRIGDQVELAADYIPPRFIAADSQLFQLKLQRLRFLRHGAGGSLRATLRSPAWRANDNLLPLPSGAAAAMAPAPATPPDDAFLAAARAAVLHYLAELPNFLVSESVTRTTRGYTETTDRIQSELAVVAGREQRSNIRFDGAAWNQPFAALPGLHWTDDFADRLMPLFQSACGAVLKPAGSTRLNGRMVTVYTFRLPPSLCAGRAQMGPELAYPGFAGKLYFDPASHLVLHLEERYTQLPNSFGQSAIRDATDWAPVSVAGAEWPMPVRSQMFTQYRAGRMVTIAVSYSGYRRFASTSQFKIVGPAPK